MLHFQISYECMYLAGLQTWICEGGEVDEHRAVLACHAHQLDGKALLVLFDSGSYGIHFIPQHFSVKSTSYLCL
jgi:hypothetical protein